MGDSRSWTDMVSFLADLFNPDDVFYTPDVDQPSGSWSGMPGAGNGTSWPGMPGGDNGTSWPGMPGGDNGTSWPTMPGGDNGTSCPDCSSSTNGDYKEETESTQKNSPTSAPVTNSPTTEQPTASSSGTKLWEANYYFIVLLTVASASLFFNLM